MTALDPESVTTAAVKKIQPEWNNHALHSLPFLFAVLDAVIGWSEGDVNRVIVKKVFKSLLFYSGSSISAILAPNLVIITVL